MTIQQIKYVIEVSRCGSISKAAKSLYTSQPNISNSIKTLEEELQVELFNRTPSGMVLTEPGSRFLQHSRSLLYELESLENLHKSTMIHQLTVCASQYPLIDNAFLRLCAIHKDDSHFQLARQILNVTDTMDVIRKEKGDLGILVTSVKQQYSVQISTNNYGLLYEPLFQLPLSIQLRADHPLLRNGSLDREHLWDYPFISQDETGENFNGCAGLSNFSFINPARSISAGNPELRSRLLLTTDAYCFAFRESDERQLVSIPLDLDMEFGAICRKDSHYNPTIQEFLQLLCDEIHAPKKNFFKQLQ